MREYHVMDLFKLDLSHSRKLIPFSSRLDDILKGLDSTTSEKEIKLAALTIEFEKHYKENMTITPDFQAGLERIMNNIKYHSMITDPAAKRHAYEFFATYEYLVGIKDALGMENFSGVEGSIH